MGTSFPSDVMRTRSELSTDFVKIRNGASPFFHGTDETMANGAEHLFLVNADHFYGGGIGIHNQMIFRVNHHNTGGGIIENGPHLRFPLLQILFHLLAGRNVPNDPHGSQKIAFSALGLISHMPELFTSMIK
jgi:hypothetical protein